MYNIETLNKTQFHPYYNEMICSVYNYTVAKKMAGSMQKRYKSRISLKKVIETLENK